MYPSMHLLQLALELLIQLLILSNGGRSGSFATKVLLKRSTSAAKLALFSLAWAR